MFEKIFKLKENKTTVGVELLAGFTTFLAMAYILVVNPQILGTVINTPDNPEVYLKQLVFVTALSGAFGSILMGILGNLPVALAPGMGMNAFFAFTVAAPLSMGGIGFTWQQALAAIFLSGIIFILITATGLREKVIRAIPDSLKAAVGVGIGDYEGKEEIDLKGNYISPSFIDTHVHIESSMIAPPLFAKNIIPKGTTTIIADPHEIANVSGLAGISYILDSTEKTPLDVYVMLPSCVPATPFETSGAILKAKDLKKLINNPRIKGLGELMNYIGVINGSKDIIDKLEIAKNKIIDGHGPNLFGKELNAYAISGVKTDHECTTPKEMLEQLRVGFYIQMRQGTVTKDVKKLLPVLNKDNLRRCLFCSDDKHPEKISERGHINENINIAIKGGVDPIDAIKIASLNAAECYDLKRKGAIAPGYTADLIVFDYLTNIKPRLVFKNGKLVAKDGKPLFKTAKNFSSKKIISKTNIKEITKSDIALHLKGNMVNVIKILPNSVITKKVVRKVKVKNGVFIKNTNIDICKIVIIERHSGKSTLFTALIEGFGIENGAISSTVAHDSHNLIIIGDNDNDILNCIRRTKELGGGITISSDSKIIGEISLKIAGLMSTEDLEVVSTKMKELTAITKYLKINKNVDPFMTLAFMALPVIPEIKITDKGLFDINLFKFITVDAK